MPAPSTPHLSQRPCPPAPCGQPFLGTRPSRTHQILFGSATNANILVNLQPEALSHLLPPPAAAALCLAIRAGYCLSLLSTFALLNWALRETVAGLVCGAPAPRTAAGFLGLRWGFLFSS